MLLYVFSCEGTLYEIEGINEYDARANLIFELGEHIEEGAVLIDIEEYPDDDVDCVTECVRSGS